MGKEARVDRAKAFSWLGIVTGLVFTPAALEAAPVGAGLLSVISVEVAPAQTPARPSRASLMLTSAIECHQRGEYEGAATLFQQCQAVMNDLSAAEQQKLSTWVQTNAAALKARQDATNLLRQSEQAQRDNQPPRTAELLKRILPNTEYLKPAEKERFKQYCDAMQAKGFSILPAGASSPVAGSSPAALANAKLQQGRSLLAQGNFSAAEQLAQEAKNLKVSYAAKEDSPAKLLDDCAKTQKDPKALLTFAHAAFEHKDYDRAEQLAHLADKEASTFTFALTSDCPTKLLKEIQIARAPKTVANAAPTKPAVEPAKSDVPDKSEMARQLLKQGREAFKAGDMAKAKTCADQAHDKGADLKWWDDTPEKLLADIQRSEATKAAAAAAKDDPRVLLKQARDLYAAGKLEEASAAAQKVKVASNTTKWGLFEDSPERLQKDIESARVKRDQEESVKVMAEARGMLERGDLDNALQASFRAEKLHGPYSILDLGDRPQKLRAEIETAKAKTAKISVPPVPGGDIAKNDKKTTEVAKTDKKDEKKGGPSLGSPIEDQRGSQQAKQLLVDARVAIKNGDLDRAENLVAQAERFQVSFKAGEDSPAAVRRDVQQIRVSVGGSAVVKNPAGGAIQRVGSDAGSGVKKQAVQILADAQQLQHAGRLIEARQRAIDAQRLNATFAPDEVSPEQVLLELAALARQRIDSLMLQSNDCMSKAGSDVSLFSKAETNLQEAKQLAASFGQDTLTINSKIEWVKQTRSQATASPLTPNPSFPATQPIAAVPNDGSPRARGMELLGQVDVALRAGDTVKARRLAEEAYQGSFGVQAEATAKLRSIDAEEEGQRRLAMNRTFDAGQSAYNRKDYAHAANILQSVDARMLDPKRQNRMREIMQTADMQAYRTDKSAVAKVQYKPEQPGVAKATDSQPDYLTQVQAMQEVKFQKLREEGLKAQRLSAECFKNGETDRALEILDEYIAALKDAQLDAERITLLKRPVEARLSQFKLMKGQRDQQTAIAKEKTDHIDSRASLARAEQNKQAEMAKLMKQYNILYKEGKYEEAEQQAMLAHELDPDNPMASAAVNIAKMSRNRDLYKKVKDNKEEMALRGLDDSEDPGAFTNTERFDPESWKKASGRKDISIMINPRKSDSEKQIERSLNSPVTLNFKDTSLGQVLQDLRTWQNINIVTDDDALAEEQVGLDRPLTMQLDQVKLKSALNLLLKKVHLTYVIEDDVLKITNEAHARGRMVAKVYAVADLVIPIQDSAPPMAGDFLRTTGERPGNAAQQPIPAAPYNGPGSLGNATSVGSPSGSQSAPSSSTPTVTKSNPNTREDQLISLITNTIAPKSWASSGGTGTIDYHPLTLALAINQTPDIQEQIADLLAALRRLQDQEVAVELRFISVAEGFYERIGVDFNINIPTGDATSKNGSLLAGGNFTNGNFPNVFDPGRFLTGFTPSGTFTPDLDIPIKNSSFGMAVPPFGGFPNIPGANGGVSMGLAFLSDIQVFLFMEAAQGDTRTNVMQAPKITLFNGQTSTITITDQQFFTTNVNIITGPNGQPIFVPLNTPVVTGGSTLTVQAVITADRRFVRLSLAPALTNLASAIVPLLPTAVIITPTFEGGFAAPPVAFTQFLQQPAFNTITVNTTVMVPDGGTVLMGGLKRLSEGRNEFGPPVLSKIPYINRLFKNVGYGREAESLLIMVTPRIIIQEEEETRMTGVVSNPQQ
jgi:type II secretory pathway component GspD/PulD (secretin)